MKVSHWKWMLLTAAAVGVPCLVLAENPEGPKTSPAVVSAQSDSAATAIVVADKEPADEDGPGHGPRDGMRGPRGPKLEKAAFLGVSTGPVNEETRAQLKLPEGTGLTIREVVPDSPAEKAGLKKFDVLTKVDDQLIIDEHQLAVLVRMHKAGDEVKLSVIHEAAPATVPVALVEKELPPLGPGAMPGPGGRGGFGDGMMGGRMGGWMREMRGGPMGGPGERGPGMGGPGMGGPGMRGPGMGGPGMGGPGMRGPGMRGQMMRGPGPMDMGREMRGGPDDGDQQGPDQGRGRGMGRGGPRGGPDGGPQGGPPGGPDDQNGPGGPGGPGAGGPPQGGPEHGGGPLFLFRGRGMRPMGGPTTRPADFEATAAWTDGDQTFAVHTKDGHSTLSVKDKDGKSIFDGPIDTPEERAKIPADVSSKLKGMRGGMMGRGGPGAEGETPDIGGPAPVADNESSADDIVQRLQERRADELLNLGDPGQDGPGNDAPTPPVQ